MTIDFYCRMLKRLSRLRQPIYLFRVKDMTQSYRPILVWSVFQRALHWTITISVLILIPLGLSIFSADYLEIPDESVHLLMDIHATVGFVFAAALVLRLAYLFTGPPASSWRDTIPHTGAQIRLAVSTVRYYLGGFRGKVPLYFAHNSFAGAAYTVFFLAGVLQAAGGITIFILHGQSHESVPEWLEEAHAVGAFVIILFVLAHLAALALHDIVEKRGLASSMISGYKFFNDEELEELKGSGRFGTGKSLEPRERKGRDA